MPAARPANGREIHFACGEQDLAGFLSIHKHEGAGIDIVCRNGNPPAGPLRGNCHLTLVPGGIQAVIIHALPTRMGNDRLTILFHVVGDSRPRAGHLEKTPGGVRHGVGLGRGRLPAPQAVQADALARRRLLPARVFQIPNRLDSWRQRRAARRFSGAANGRRKCEQGNQACQFEMCSHVRCGLFSVYRCTWAVRAYARPDQPAKTHGDSESRTNVSKGQGRCP